MDIKETLASLKPHLVGGAVGAVAITIVGFSADWVVSTDKMESKVEEARVSALTEVCALNAERHWKETGHKLAALEGWDNKDRERLAKEFTPEIGSIDKITEDIRDQCEDALRP